MKREKIWWIVAVLIITNCLTIFFFLVRGTESREVVAKVGNEKITRQEWLNEMESRYGREVLSELVDQKVIETAGKKYQIKISDKAVEQEIKMIQAMYGSTAGIQSSNEEKWKTQIKNNLILEELLTRDVNVSEANIKEYFQENQEQFKFPDVYHISQIIVKTQQEAQQTVKELEQGSNFDVLAMERSIDEFTANQGGDAGYISKDNEHYPEDFFEQIKMLQPGEWSKPIKIKENYAIVMLHEHIDAKAYSYEEVKDYIRRQIALEQMDTPMSAKSLWNETDVEWFYGNSED